MGKYIGIMAIGENGELGNKGKLPFDLPKDRQFFWKHVAGKIVLCGRKTYESIKNNLKFCAHEVVVLSSRPFRSTKVGSANSLDMALISIGEIQYESKKDLDVLIIGGTSVFQGTKHLWDEAYITHVESKNKIEADVYVLDILKDTMLHEGQIMCGGKEGNLSYTTVHYTR